jgi:aldehyde dehydrogenase (NAD+)
VNCANSVEIAVPFGGYKQSGNGGRELGEYALETYVAILIIPPVQDMMLILR